MTNYEILQMKLVSITKLENACKEENLETIIRNYTDFQLDYIESLLLRDDLVGIRLTILEAVRKEKVCREESDKKFEEKVEIYIESGKPLSTPKETLTSFIKMDRNIKLSILDKAVEIGCIEDVLNEFTNEELEFIEGTLIMNDVINTKTQILANIKMIQFKRVTPNFSKSQRRYDKKRRIKYKNI